jgi:hypothetical protein
MDLKKFKSTLESTFGKRLDKLQKDLLSTKLDLEKVRSNLQDLNKFIEDKHTKNRKSLQLRPKVLQKAQTKRESDLTPLIPVEESKQRPPVVKEINESKQPLQKPEPRLKFQIIHRESKKAKPRQTLDQITSQLKDLEQHYQIENLNSRTDFNISLGAKSAFDIIKGMNKETFKLPEVPDKKILWAFGLLLQLLGEDFNPDGENARNRVQNFLDACLESGNILEFFLAAIKGFNFENENIDGVEEYIFGKDEMIAPQIYNNVSQLCGLLMVTLREAVAYCGFVKGKTPIWRTYQRLLYKKRSLEGG